MKPFKKYESRFDRKAATSVRNEFRRKKEEAKYEEEMVTDDLEYDHRDYQLVQEKKSRQL